MSEANVNILKFTDAGLKKIHEALLEIPTKFGWPLIQDIDVQLKAAAAEADKLKIEAESYVKGLETKVAEVTKTVEAEVSNIVDAVERVL